MYLWRIQEYVLFHGCIWHEEISRKVLKTFGDARHYPLKCLVKQSSDGNVIDLTGIWRLNRNPLDTKLISLISIRSLLNWTSCSQNDSHSPYNFIAQMVRFIEGK